MEIDVKHSKQRNKRRERAQRMQAERDKDADGVGIVDGDSADEDSKKPIRPPQRRKKANIFKEPSPILEEDVVDGFAILSFKTYEDLEVSHRLNNNFIFKKKKSYVLIMDFLFSTEALKKCAKEK